MWPVDVWVNIINTNLRICFLLKLSSCELDDHFASHAWSLVIGARKAAVAGAHVLNCVVFFFLSGSTEERFGGHRGADVVLHW